jgi:hypothetical protein
MLITIFRSEALRDHVAKFKEKMMIMLQDERGQQRHKYILPLYKKSDYKMYVTDHPRPYIGCLDTRPIKPPDIEDPCR